MKNTVSLCTNNRFRWLYSKGKSQVAPSLVVYCGKNRKATEANRLGITVSAKIGGAVVRNNVRRKIKEIYRLNETRFQVGYDLIVVARNRATSAHYSTLERDLLLCFEKLGLVVR